MSSADERSRQARLDLDELDAQVAAGEIDPPTADRLRATYLDELAAAVADAGEHISTPTRSPIRVAIGAAILVVGVAVAVVVAGASVEGRDPDALQGVAAVGEFDPDAYSDETLEAAIAGFADDPSVADRLPYMRFALAERYFERGEYQQAFAHYEQILAGDPPADLFSATMTRIAWITYAGNGEIDLALDVIDRAIEAAPGSTEARYVKGQIVWCGRGDAGAAAVLFEQVLTSDQLDDATRTQVEADLAASSGGEACR